MDGDDTDELASGIGTGGGGGGHIKRSRERKRNIRTNADLIHCVANAVLPIITAASNLNSNFLHNIGAYRLPAIGEPPQSVGDPPLILFFAGLACFGFLLHAWQV